MFSENTGMAVRLHYESRYDDRQRLITISHKIRINETTITTLLVTRVSSVQPRLIIDGQHPKARSAIVHYEL